MTADDLKLLRAVEAREAEPGQLARIREPPSPRIEDLVQRGYLRIAKVRCGPLGIYTGDRCVTLTEAGKIALGLVQSEASS